MEHDLLETLEILLDKDTMAAFRQGIKEIRQGIPGTGTAMPYVGRASASPSERMAGSSPVEANFSEARPDCLTRAEPARGVIRPGRRNRASRRGNPLSERGGRGPAGRTC